MRFRLFDLNDAQRDAVTAIDGPLLILAGAGTAGLSQHFSISEFQYLRICSRHASLYSFVRSFGPPAFLIFLTWSLAPELCAEDELRPALKSLRAAGINKLAYRNVSYGT